MTNINILKPVKYFKIEYPEAIEWADNQAHVLWFPNEFDLEKDLHDIKTRFTPSEYHGLITVLKLFTLYELRVGDDYWGTIIANMFKRPEIQRMAATFSYVELGIHAPFYNRINEILGLDNDDFYLSYLQDPVLKDRMQWLDRRISKTDTDFDRLKSIAIFSMIEGAILYSSFAYIKHFQAKGKNKAANICAGITLSEVDENIHSQAGAWLFRTYLKEVLDSDISFDLERLVVELREVADVISSHEAIIISKIFEKGEQEGITSTDLLTFVNSRLNLCLSNLGIRELYEEKDVVNPVADWFYDSANKSKLHDFFIKGGNEYNRNWKRDKFLW